MKPQPLLNPEHFSDWDRLVRVTVHCQRFVKNTKYTTQDPSKITKGEQCAKRKVEPWSSPGSLSRKGRCSEKPASQDTEWRTEEIDPEMLHTLGSQVRSHS